MHSKKIIKKITALTTAVTLAFMLSACSEGETPAAPTDAAVDAPTDTTEEAPAVETADAASDEEAEAPVKEQKESGETKDASEKGYIDVYRTLVNEMSDSGKADQFILAYIDGDDIPELLASNSEGPFDQENTFIYKVYNDDPVLLASVIAGVEGASLSYSDKNMIRQTGSVTGTAEVFSSIADDSLKEEFRAEMLSTLETDANGDEVFSYSINGKEVTPEEYEKQLAEFNAQYAPFVVIDFDGLNVMDFKDGKFEEATQLVYWSAADTLDTLDSMASE